MERRPPIVGSIIERKPTSKVAPPKPYSSGKTGFPTVQHRSKSAFARSREDLRKNKSRDVPVVQSVPRSASPQPVAPVQPNSDGWRDQVSRENEARVAEMTEEEREEERREILERFGANIGDILKRARLARERQQSGQAIPEPPAMEARQLSEGGVPVTSEERKPMPHLDRVASPPPSALVTPGNSRPASRLDRKLRFAELEPDDVHVYEHLPDFPEKKQRTLALPPPDPNDRAQSLGKWHGTIASQLSTSVPPEPMHEEPEEGSAEYIRRRFFPYAPKDDPNLAWMSLDSNAAPSKPSSDLRFDLHGNIIPPVLSSKLPTHLGLHHHAEGAHAGYTLDDIFLLSRSTVPAQRSIMLGIMVGICQRLRGNEHNVLGMDELRAKEEELRKRFLAAGAEAISEKGNVGPLAIEVVWECIVGWDAELIGVDGVELSLPQNSIIETLPIEYFLPQVVALLKQGGVPLESSNQLLSILHRLAQQSQAIAYQLVSTPQLLPVVLQTFLLTPIPSEDTLFMPNPLALRLFYVLAQSSRANALEIERISDSLLRFVAFSPFSSPYPPQLCTSLLIGTLRVFRSLATYGLYAHIAGTAQMQFAEVERYVISEACHSEELVVSWCSLMEAWTICAVDPHQTSPTHDIIWSQISGWAWHESIAELQSHLNDDEKDWMRWCASWKVQAAWLEGSKINGVRGGQAERFDFVEIFKAGFENGVESRVINGVLDALQSGLDDFRTGDIRQLELVSNYTLVLTSAIRLWLACLAPHSVGPPESPPFFLPYSRISALARKLLTHPLWLSPDSSHIGVYTLHLRKFSGLMAYYLSFSQRLPDVSLSLWVAQAFSILLRLQPGDEAIALDIVKELMGILTMKWTTPRDIKIPSVVWQSGGLSILEPFFVNIVRPQVDTCISPTVLTPQSIKQCTTERLPLSATLQQWGLPLQKEWSLCPLDHLLRSGDSPVFKALPTTWDSSECEVVRASLAITKIAQITLSTFSMFDFILTREGAEFGCMKVFMLEHGQPQNDSSEEVFRDDVVCHLMEDVLKPYEWGVVGSDVVPSEDLEKVATRFLGPSVPFFQFYTDFVGLYDAISFSHPLFARLLLPPTSMRYPLDYRKHLWSDFNHIVRTISVLPECVLSGDIKDFTYPVENDKQVITGYLSTLLQDNTRDFTRLVAVHHIASNIWPDLHGSEEFKEEKSSMLLKAIISQGGIEVIRQVVQYQQTAVGEFLIPPSCFGGLTTEQRESRIECIYRWGGQAMVNRLQNLLVV